MIFRNPLFLLLLPLLVFLVIYKKKVYKPASIKFSSGDFLGGLRESPRVKLSRNAIILRSSALFLIVLALAGPRRPLEDYKIRTEGIEIVLAIDVSTSMLAEDFTLDGRRVNRLEAVKDVVRDFIGKRRDDRIGMVAFAGMPYTVSPLTLDHTWLLKNLERVKIGMAEDGTAIGSGLGTSLNRLKDSELTSKIIVLLTDGRNNAGKISPFTAAEAAKALEVKVYTIGAGTEGMAPYPARDYFGNIVYREVKIEIDEKTLQKIADTTGAKYYRATDTENLRKIYDEIDRLEKTKMEEKGYTEFVELFPVFLIPALALILIEIILANTVLRRVP
jgi:Ca-activated chloride channel family protein